MSVYGDIAELLVGLAARPEADPPKGHLGYQDDDGNYQIADEDDRNRAYVRVNLNGAETVISALNYAPLLPDYPVILFRRGRDYYALPDHDRLLDYFEATGLPVNAVQAHSHEPEFGLMDFVSSIRLRPGLIYVESGMTISVASKPYLKLDGTPGMSTPTTVDLSAHEPATAGEHQWVVLSINRADGTVTTTDGTPKAADDALTSAEAYALVPWAHDPLFAVRVEYDDSGLSYQDFLDLRLWAATGEVGQVTLKHTYDGTAAPTVNDDSADGYSVGSRWFDVTSSKEYVCFDATAGAADWQETTGGGGVTDHGALTGLTDDDHTQYLPRSGVRSMTANLGMGGFNITSLGFLPAHASPATIDVSGAITVTSFFHTVSPNTGSADELVTINPAATRTFLILHSPTTADITVKHGTGNIKTQDSADYVMPRGSALLFVCNGAEWWVVGNVSTSSSSPTITDFTNAQHDHQDVAGGGQLTDSALAAPVGIAKGGTGETTAADAFDALAPTTTKGDLIAHDGTNNVRLPVGSDYAVLVAHSTFTAGIDWTNAIDWFNRLGAKAFSGPVRNAAGTAAIDGDVGYLDYDTTYGMVYKRTTTANFDPSRVCVVVVGGPDTSTIYVTQLGAEVTASYTGTAPNAGQFLVTSTTAGRAQAQTTMHPRIFAVCVANGSSGQVLARMLTRTQRVTLDASDDVLRVQNHSDTAFTSTISGAPTATSVVYGAISSGAENVLVPSASTQLGKMRLWNTTRGTYRLIESVNTATNTITTVSSTDSWANGDSITILSQTTSAGTAADYIEVDLSQTAEIPLLTRFLDLQGIERDTGAGSMALSFHPYLTYDANKVVNTFTPSANVFTAQVFPADLYNRVFTFRSAASGAGTKTSAFKVMAYNIACP